MLLLLHRCPNFCTSGVRPLPYNPYSNEETKGPLDSRSRAFPPEPDSATEYLSWTFRNAKPSFVSKAHGDMSALDA